MIEQHFGHLQATGLPVLAGEVDHARRCIAHENCEAHARIIEHPLGTIRLEYGWPAGEHRRIKTDACGEVMDREIYLHGVHEVSSRCKQRRSGIESARALENRRRTGRMRRGGVRMRLGHPKISKQPHDMPTDLRSQLNRGSSHVDLEIPVDPPAAVVCDERSRVARSMNDHDQVCWRAIQHG